VALATPLALFGWKAAASAAVPGMMVPWPDRPGLRCLAVALECGIAPLAAFLVIWSRTQPANPRLTGVALGVAAGAVSWLLVDLWCPVGHAGHLLVGHVLPVVLLAGGGAAASGLLAVSRRWSEPAGRR
jgi:hypothetical protein